MANFKFDLFFIILIGIIFTLSTGCQLIIDNDISFFVSEVYENHTKGSKLPGSIYVKKDYESEAISIDMTNSGDTYEFNYTSAVYSMDSGCIEFYLLESLPLYRISEKWVPSIESNYTVRCSGQAYSFIYLLLVKDENLYAPKFDYESYTGLLTYSKYFGFHFQLNQTYDATNELKGIHLTDLDFNPAHANVNIECSGQHCPCFTFEPINGIFDEKSFQIDVKIILNVEALREIATDGMSLQLELAASDSLHTSQANLTIYVSMEDQFDPEMDTVPSPFPMLPVIIGAGIAALLLIACSGALAYFVVRSKKSKDLVRKLTEAEIREFLEGTVNIAGDHKRSVDVNTPIMALPYNQAFEIPRDRLRIDETTILGSGAFGVVWKGFVAYTNGSGHTVAVKSIKRNVGVLYFKALLSELKIMAYIGKHPNIVSLVGACTHNIRKREVYIAVEYCANGNFHNYLKCRRDTFKNQVVDGTLQLTNAAAYSYMYSNKGIFFSSISTMDLLKWAIQIANGLQYLESLGVIHGDLATRNILLNKDRTAKIGDFGLSRRLVDYSNYSNYYTKTTQAPLPWKWMAPESLKDMKFSKKSDIWSFGIVLWEIFSLAQTPYPGQNWDEMFLEKLENGMRPKRPHLATFLLYDLMCDCWNLDPYDRPSILDVKRCLEEITNSALRQKHDSSYMRFLGEQQPQVITMLNEDQDGYLLPIDPNRVDYVDT